MIRLKIISGGKAGTTIESPLFFISIGREPSCNLQLDPYQDLSVHGNHACIYFSANSYHLKDLQTKNGTYLNNKSIETPTPIEKGMVFRLGNQGPEIRVESWSLPSEKDTLPRGFLRLINTRSKEIFVFSAQTSLIRIGRQHDCEIPLDPLKEREVSGYHTSLEYRDDSYHLHDLQSANGTYLNGKACQSQKLGLSGSFQLGNQGPTFSFEYKPEKISSKEKVKQELWEKIQRLQEVIAIKTPSKETLVHFVKEGKKRFWADPKKRFRNLSIVLGSFFFFCLMVVVLQPQILTPEEIKTTYQSSVVVTYSRYLVYSENKVLRGEKYGCGIIIRENNQSYILTAVENVYPWKKQVQKDELNHIVTHMVAAWPSDRKIFQKEITVPYQAPLIENSFNNQLARLGGQGEISLPNPNNYSKKDLLSICKLPLNTQETSSPEISSLVIMIDKSKEKKQPFHCLTYSFPPNDDGYLLIHCLSVKPKEKAPTATSGSPIFGENGKLIGFAQEKVQITEPIFVTQNSLEKK